MGVPGRPARAARNGFTLFELILTVSLILLLAGGVIFGWDSLQRGARLEEGADQVEMLLRFARAQAATSGRQVRVEVGSLEPFPGITSGTNSAPASNPTAAPGGLRVLWEPDPLKRPGTFEPLPGTEGFRERIEDLVEVQSPESVQQQMAPPGTPTPVQEGETNGAPSDLSGLAGPNPETQQRLRINFYPDGSSDSADWVLISKDSGDGRRLRIRWSGLTGSARRQWLERTDVPGMTNAESLSPPMETAGGESFQKNGP